MKMHIQVKFEEHETVSAVDDAFISCWVGMLPFIGDRVGLEVATQRRSQRCMGSCGYGCL
eukprot:CAMPEP_0203944210 /NCGR_PEP_ID=MMETSP0359-20131031/80011_1 /ASSEMBLY_ACC=CAM_ASM_000338 /TAXON_ID=268821 /ORGANISM="Scrippsiella Hangoei, Strain SHTV-5" /LENGTH=59 /DNA_ID=CAMNT_0050875187 /DNA_START=382 /DNA_END=561 /DNA_ORIENTATION=+